MMMLAGYTFARMTSTLYYCSKKNKGCKAKVKLGKDMRVSNPTEIIHDHDPPKYMVTQTGQYIKLSS